VKKINMSLSNMTATILHVVKVQMGADLDPERLEEELHSRARRRADNPTYGAHYTQVERDLGVQCYRITLVDLDALPVIYAILGEIEADIAAAQEQQRILGLLTDKGGN